MEVGPGTSGRRFNRLGHNFERCIAVLTFQAEGGAYALYVNGTNMGEGSDSQTLSALNALGGTFKGEIAEVVAYNRLLPD